MQKQDFKTLRGLLVFTEIGKNRKRGRPKTRWIDNVTDDLARMGIRNWRRKTKEREITNSLALSNP